VNQEFNTIMAGITKFLKPIVASIKNKKRMDKSWDSKRGSWKK